MEGKTCIACGAQYDVPGVAKTPRWCVVCDPSSIKAVYTDEQGEGEGDADDDGEEWLDVEPVNAAGMTASAATEQAKWAARARAQSQLQVSAGAGLFGFAAAAVATALNDDEQDEGRRVEERSISAEYVVVKDHISRHTAEAAGGMGGMPREAVNVGLTIDSMQIGSKVKAIRDSAKGKYSKGHTGKCTGVWGDRIWIVWDHNSQESRTADWHDAVVIVKTGG